MVYSQHKAPLVWLECNCIYRTSNVALVHMNAKNAAAESVAKVGLSRPFPLTLMKL